MATNFPHAYTASCDKTVGIFNIDKTQQLDSLDFIHTSNIAGLEGIIYRLYQDTIYGVKLIKGDKFLITCSVDRSVVITVLQKRQVVKKFDKAHTSKAI